MAANRWLLKTEPSEYAWADLLRDRRARWDGITNALALKHLRTMRAGDQALIYHTGDERAIVGVARIASDPYPDPEAGDGKLVVVDVEPVRALETPVTLAAIKADPAFADFALVKQGRLSVVPVTADEWRRLVGKVG